MKLYVLSSESRLFVIERSEGAKGELRALTVLGKRAWGEGRTLNR